MSNTLDGNQSIVSSILFPENLLINDSVGVIEVNERQIYDENEYTDQFDRFFYDDQNESMIDQDDGNFLLSSMENFKYTYLINNRKNTILSSHICYPTNNEYHDWYKEKISDELSSNVKNENGYAIYYENPIDLNVSSNFIQVNNNIYVINKNLFDIQNNSCLNNSHVLNKKYQNIKNLLLKYYNRDTKFITEDLSILHNIHAKLIDENLNISGIVISGTIGETLKSSDVILTGYIDNKLLKTPIDSLLMSSLINFDESFEDPALSSMSKLLLNSPLRTLNISINDTLSNIFETIKLKYVDFYQNNSTKINMINNLLDSNIKVADKWIKGFLAMDDDINKKQIIMIDDIAISFSCFDKNVSDINDKSVPVYNLSAKALENVNILKPSNPGLIVKLIEKYKPVFKKFDPDFEEKILYDGESEQFSTTTYDSIYIEPLFKILSQTNECSGFFDDLFSILPLSSFYRFLNPIGKIDSSITFNNELALTDNDNVTDYVYLINNQNINSETCLTKNIEFNYFTLKNLKNPENVYDYSLIPINEDVSYDTNYFDPDQTHIDQIVNYFNDTKNEIINYILNHQLTSELVDNFISEYELTSALIDIAIENYDNVTESEIRNCINQNYKNANAIAIRKSALLLLFTKNEYGFNLSRLEYKKLIYFIEIEKFKQFINDLENEFVLKFGSLSSLKEYKNVLNFFEAIKKYIPTNNKNNNNIFRNNQIVKILNFVKELKITTKNKQIGKYTLNQIMTNLEQHYGCSYENEKDDMLSVYSEYFSKENFMKIGGYLYGSRKYKKLSKSNCLNKPWVSYSYFTSCDKNFKEDNLDIVISSHLFGNNVKISNFNDIISLSYSDVAGKYICILPENDIKDMEYIFIKDNESFAYVKMLGQMNKFEFVDLVEGLYSFKTSNIKKSNVYSLKLENTNLNYTYNNNILELYSYNEALLRLKINNINVTNNFLLALGNKNITNEILPNLKNIDITKKIFLNSKLSIIDELLPILNNNNINIINSMFSKAIEKNIPYPFETLSSYINISTVYNILLNLEGDGFNSNILNNIFIQFENPELNNKKETAIKIYKSILNLNNQNITFNQIFDVITELNQNDVNVKTIFNIIDNLKSRNSISKAHEELENKNIIIYNIVIKLDQIDIDLNILYNILFEFKDFNLQIYEIYEILNNISFNKISNLYDILNKLNKNEKNISLNFIYRIIDELKNNGIDVMNQFISYFNKKDIDIMYELIADWSTANIDVIYELLKGLKNIDIIYDLFVNLESNEKDYETGINDTLNSLQTNNICKLILELMHYGIDIIYDIIFKFDDNIENKLEYNVKDILEENFEKIFIKKLNLYKIFDITESKNAEIYLKHATNILLSQYKFYEFRSKSNEETLTLEEEEERLKLEDEIKIKMKMRKTLEESIRKSIDKYMPVNTQLWKIEYEGI